MNQVNEELNGIIRDNTSGSRELLRKLNAYLEKHLREYPDKLELIGFLKEKFIGFAAVTEYLDRLKDTLSHSDGLSKIFVTYSDDTRLYRKIFAKAFPLIRDHKKFLTISNSRTIIGVAALLKESNPEIEFSVSESRPLLEGRIMARKLAECGIPVALGTEASMPGFVEACDAALIGADRILNSGNIINKIGSLGLAIMCRYFGKPLYVIADRSKLSDFTPVEGIHPREEIWRNPPANITIRNRYFEEVNGELITAIITD